MACETRPKAGQTKDQRIAAVRAALARLEQGILGGKVQVKIGPQGAVAFDGWADRDDITDACAFRMLTGLRSNTLRRAVEQAQLAQGRQVNVQAVSAGWHSHDGGATWGKH